MNDNNRQVVSYRGMGIHPVAHEDTSCWVSDGAGDYEMSFADEQEAKDWIDRLLKIDKEIGDETTE